MRYIALRLLNCFHIKITIVDLCYCRCYEPLPTAQGEIVINYCLFQITELKTVPIKLYDFTVFQRVLRKFDVAEDWNLGNLIIGISGRLKVITIIIKCLINLTSDIVNIVVV